MKYSRNIFRKIFSVCITLSLVLSFCFAPVSQTLNPKEAEAIFCSNCSTIIGEGLQLIEDAATTISSGLTAESSLSLQIKDYVLDTIAWGLVNVMVKEMIKAMTKWVNSGFDGNPAFVTDLGGFMTDVADKVAGNFIWKNEDLKFLCSPFALDIKLALDLQYREARNFETQCTLSDVVDNMDNFFAGDFLAGGWDGWYEMTQNPKSNPYGALLDAQSALTVKIANKKLYEGKLLDFGSGFLSQQECKNVIIAGDREDGSDSEEKEVCKTVTPGNVIQTQLNTALSLPAGRLQVADELNELLGAVFSQLVSNIFSSASGLLGSTESGSGSNGGSIFDDTDNEPDESNPNPGGSVFARIIEQERKYFDLLLQLVDMIAGAQGYWESAYAEDDETPRTAGEERCYEAGVTNFPASLLQTLSETRFAVVVTSSTIAEFEELQNDLLTLSDSESDESVISALLIKYEANSTPAARAKVTDRLSSIQTSGVLHTAQDYSELDRGTMRRIDGEIATFIESVDRECQSSRGGDGGGG